MPELGTILPFALLLIPVGYFAVNKLLDRNAVGKMKKNKPMNVGDARRLNRLHNQTGLTLEYNGDQRGGK